MNALTITNAGQTRVASALSAGVPIRATRMAVGSFPANLLTPASTALGNELLRLPVQTGTVNGNQVNFEAVVPAELGPFTLREMALYDDTGVLIAYGSLPDIYKPAIVNNFSVAVRIIATLAFSAGTPVTVIQPATGLEDAQVWTTPDGRKYRLVLGDDLIFTPVQI